MNDWPIYIGLPLWFWLFIFPTLFAAFCLTSRHMATAFATDLARFGSYLCGQRRDCGDVHGDYSIADRGTDGGTVDEYDFSRRHRICGICHGLYVVFCDGLCPDTRVAHSRFNFLK